MLQDPVEEARHIITVAQAKGIVLRLLGGVAFSIRCPSATREGLNRKYVDIDFVGLRRQRTAINKLFTDLNYAPRTTFNAMSGGIRLIYNDLEHQRRADVFLDIFEMSHKFDFTKRLKIDDVTLPLADLLLTKLQVHEITEKEHKDTIALLKDAQLGDSDGPNAINQTYIAELCGKDWGLYKTVTLNLDRLQSALPQYPLEASEQEALKLSIAQIRSKIEDYPKSVSWKMRAKIGERVRWYEVPEGDQEIVDSRSLSERRPPGTPEASV